MREHEPERRHEGAQGERGVGPGLTSIGTAALVALRHPVIPVFVIAGIFEILSGDPIDRSIFLFVAAAALAWDRRKPGVPAGGVSLVTAPSEMASTPAVRIGPFVILVAVAYAWIAGGFARFTWPITISIAVPGISAVVAAWFEPVERRRYAPKLDPAGVVAWASLFIALGIWELGTLLMQPGLRVNSYAHPTISYLLDPILNQHHLDRSIALGLWLAFGWYLMER